MSIPSTFTQAPRLMSQMSRAALRALLIPSPCFVAPGSLWARKHLLALDATSGKRWTSSAQGYGFGGPRISGLKWSVAVPRLADPELGRSRRDYRLIRDVGSFSKASQANLENLLQVGGAPKTQGSGCASVELPDSH